MATKLIPRDVMISTEVRGTKDLDMKAAHIKLKCVNLPLTSICKEIGADYYRAYRRYNCLKMCKPWQEVGRPALVGACVLKKAEQIIREKYKKGECWSYHNLSVLYSEEYAEYLRNLPPEKRETLPPTLRSNYVYETKGRLEIDTHPPVLAEQDRNECSTTATIHWFFDTTYTEEFCEGVPPDLLLNADETSVEVGLPRKVIVPAGEGSGAGVDKFATSSHITAMITINATGDDFPPFVLVPLKRLPAEVSGLIRAGKITFGGSPKGWMTDESFKEWSIWLIDRIVQIRAQRGYAPDQRAILFLDGHGSRNNADVMRLFREANIDVVIFPPHMTHLFQPFDRVIARPLKDALGAIARAILEDYDESDQKKIKVIRLTQIEALIDANRAATLTRNCRKAFETCGLYPRNPKQVLQSKGVKNSKKNFIQPETHEGQSLKISGKCITADDVFAGLRKKE